MLTMYEGLLLQSQGGEYNYKRNLHDIFRITKWAQSVTTGVINYVVTWNPNGVVICSSIVKC